MCCNTFGGELQSEKYNMNQLRWISEVFKLPLLLFSNKRFIKTVFDFWTFITLKKTPVFFEPPVKCSLPISHSFLDEFQNRSSGVTSLLFELLLFIVHFDVHALSTSCRANLIEFFSVMVKELSLEL